MKYQSLFPGKSKKKYFKMLSAEIFTQHAMHKTTVTFLQEKGLKFHSKLSPLNPCPTEPGYILFENSVDPKQLPSEEAN